MRVPVAPYPHQCLVLFAFFILVILVVVECNLIVILNSNFPDDTFSCAFGHLCIFFYEQSIQVVCSLKKYLVACVFIIEFYEFFNFLDSNPLSHCVEIFYSRKENFPFYFKGFRVFYTTKICIQYYISFTCIT